MGSQGEDIILGKQSRQIFPYSVECKNQEKVNVWERKHMQENRIVRDMNQW